MCALVWSLFVPKGSSSAWLPVFPAITVTFVVYFVTCWDKPLLAADVCVVQQYTPTISRSLLAPLLSSVGKSKEETCMSAKSTLGLDAVDVASL